MALNKNEKLLVEAVQSFLGQDAKLGLSLHDDDKAAKEERGFQYLHEQIDDLFAIRAADLVHAESVTSAFRKVHSHKYMDDWTFLPAFEKELVARTVPMVERRKAMEFIPRIMTELREEHHNWTERDAGLNPNLDEIREASWAGAEDVGEFQVHSRPLNKKNVEKPTRGDGSPARTSMKQPPLPDDGHDAEVDPGDGEGNL